MRVKPYILYVSKRNNLEIREGFKGKTDDD